jgi:hypothetical protein
MGRFAEDERAMSYRLLRACAVILAVLGWVHLIFFLALGFVPWFVSVDQVFPVSSPWEQWVIYLFPMGGLILGGLTALGYFIGSQMIRVVLDQRDLLEELLGVNRRLLRIIEGKKAGGGPREADLFRLDESEDDDLPSL